METIITCEFYNADMGAHETLYLLAASYSPSSSDFVADIKQARIFASRGEAIKYAKDHFSEGNDVEYHQLKIESSN